MCRFFDNYVEEQRQRLNRTLPRPLLVRSKTLRGEKSSIAKFIVPKDHSAIRLGRCSLHISVGLAQLRMKINDFYHEKSMIWHPIRCRSACTSFYDVNNGLKLGGRLTGMKLSDLKNSGHWPTLLAAFLAGLALIAAPVVHNLSVDFQKE